MTPNPTPPTAPAADQELEQLKAESEQLAKSVDRLRRQQTILEHLAKADAVDSETALLLVQHRLDTGSTDAIPAIIAELKNTKPHLFAVRPLPEGAPTTRTIKQPHQAARPVPNPAAATNRAAMMDYMRTRRQNPRRP